MMRTLLGLGVVLLACSDADGGSADTDQTVVVGADWVRVEATCGYSFEAPPELAVQTAQGIDSCVEAWSTTSCVYRGDYGGFSSDLSEYDGLPEYREMQRSIDGRSAKVVTARSERAFITAVHFPEVDPDREGLRLTVWAECDDAAGQREASAALGTITFE